MLHKVRSASPRIVPALRAALAVALAGAAFAGCSSVRSALPSMPSLPFSTPSIKEGASAETLYNEGVKLLADKKYVPAIERFQKLRSDYPFAPELVSTEIKLAEAYYLNKQYTESVETLKEFEAMHPNNENIPYALYISGMAHFDQFSTIDRDMKNTEVAKGFFERVVNNYPQSPFAAKSQEKLAKCLEYLAGHEFEIASYYMREKKYPAARDRLEGILRRYRNTSVAPKALYQLGESYRQEKNNVKAALAFDALTQHYPNDPLAKDARSQLTQIAQEKQDPLTALLKQEPRPAAALAQNKTADDTKADAKASAKDAPRIAKTEVVDEKPGDDKSFLERVANKLNPFSSSSPAPAKEPEKKPTATARTSKTVSPNNAQLISSIDSSLERRTSASASEPAPPAPDLPQITEAPLPPSRNEAATLSAIDGKLDKKTQVAAVVPPPPQAAPVLKTPIVDEKALAQSKSQGQPATDPATLLSSIDTKLNRQGINGQSEETKLELPAGQKPIATPRPKPAVPEKVLDTKIKTETGPLFLPQQEIRGQEKEAETPAPAATASAPAPSPSLPELAVKGPPQPDKPADTKVAGKPKTTGDDALDDPENKGVFDQLKEDLQRVGKILNPFSW